MIRQRYGGMCSVACGASALDLPIRGSSLPPPPRVKPLWRQGGDQFCNREASVVPQLAVQNADEFCIGARVAPPTCRNYREVNLFTWGCLGCRQGQGFAFAHRRVSRCS